MLELVVLLNIGIYKAMNKMSSERKKTGATFTPKILSDFVSINVLNESSDILKKDVVRILEPSIGEGELICSILENVEEKNLKKIEVYGFDTNMKSVDVSECRLKTNFPSLKKVDIRHADFLQFFVDGYGGPFLEEKFDLIIANPPYVRTQVMGTELSRQIASVFKLTGRVDLYQAFVVAMLESLAPDGTMGVIVSNRFMSVKNGEIVRQAFLDKSHVSHVWDLGDTKLFDAAVLPAVIITKGLSISVPKATFTSIYETTQASSFTSSNPIEALNQTGNVQVGKQVFKVQKGNLDASLDGWRLSNVEVENWIKTVESKTWKTFRDIGKIRVGVKTCADKVFIRKDWGTVPTSELPELLRPLTTHFIARRFKADKTKADYRIVYPHKVDEGKRKAIDLQGYPNTLRYLTERKEILQARKYVEEAGRNWYEIWVPQDPGLWRRKKIVFRDISKEPIFWLDNEGTVVNGDCYWFVAEDEKNDDLLWLAMAVANSPFIEKFYDIKFNNKLYSGRRRFITQYVEKFPLPNPSLEQSQKIIALSKKAFNEVDGEDFLKIKQEIDDLVWQSFS